MKNALECALIIVATATLAAAGLLCGRAYFSLEHFDSVTDQASTTLANTARLTANLTRQQAETQAKTKVMLDAAAGSLKELRLALFTVNKQTLPDFNRDQSKVMGSLNQLLADTDKNLADLSRQTQQSVADFAQSSKTLVAATVKTEETAQSLLADPAMVGNLRQTSTDLRVSVSHLPAVMTDLEAEQHDVRRYVHRLTQPPKTIVAILEGVGNYGVKFFGAAWGAH